MKLFTLLKSITMKILIAGCGNMGSTYVESFIRSKVVEPANLYIVETNPNRIAELKGRNYPNIYSHFGAFVADIDLLMLCVKPQDFERMAGELKPYLGDQLVLSIMAGMSIEKIKETLGGKGRIVRAMPNLPAQLGYGMTVFTVSPDVDKIHLFAIQNLINTTGKSLYVNDEGMLDAATALSGSGPAYVFYFIDVLVEAGKKMGFTQQEAELLVKQTFAGAINLLEGNNLNPKEWIGRVASRGGTTEAALKTFDETQLASYIKKGVEAAYNRSVELGK